MLHISVRALFSRRLLGGPCRFPGFFSFTRLVHMDMKLKNADEVSTATVVAAGLIGGWLTARESGIRPLGTVPLVASGALAARSWNKKKGPAVTAALLGTYVGAFGLSHPLAKKIGAWPAVLTATGAVAAIAYAVSDSR